MFEKDLYWARRNHMNEIKNDKGKVLSKEPQPLRGQGEPLAPKLVAVKEPSHMVKTKRGFESVNRATARRKVKIRALSKPNYGSQEIYHDRPKKKLFEPLHPPYTTNHMRHTQRQLQRKQKLIEERAKREKEKTDGRDKSNS